MRAKLQRACLLILSLSCSTAAATAQNPNQDPPDTSSSRYLNPNSRIMANYVEGELDNLDGAFRAFTIRFQVAF